MNDKYIRQMKKGVLDMLVLKLLNKEQKYGYQLIYELKEKSGELFILKEGTLCKAAGAARRESRWRASTIRLQSRESRRFLKSGSCGCR